jgi:hypothetical protein
MGIFTSTAGYTEMGRNTYDMGLDGQSIKLLLVVKLRFGRVIGDEDNLFLYKGRTEGSGQAGQGDAGKRNGTGSSLRTLAA